jgi:hypothetical protein
MGYFIKMYRLEPFPEFVQRSQAVLEHHFNNHSLCGKWCAFSMDLEPEKRKEITTEMAKKFRDKIKQKGLYELVQKLTMHLLSPERLQECHHSYDSQKRLCGTAGIIATETATEKPKKKITASAILASWDKSQKNTPKDH